MRRLLTGLIAFTALAVFAPSAASGQQYFLGKGDANKTTVAFRVVNGQIKHGLIESTVDLDGPPGPDSITAYGSFRAAALDAKNHFSCTVDRLGHDATHPDYHLTFAGRVTGDEAVGRTSTRTKGGIADFDSGQVTWTAEEVSKKDFEDFASFGDALADHYKRPSCD